ncbi:MAG: hypothetical protein AAB875_03210 [Patescibacteria group bacterium]
MDDDEIKEMMILMQDKFCELIKENPAIIVAMARGGKSMFWFDLPPKKDNVLTIQSSIGFPEGREMTLKEFFETNYQPK